MSRSHLLDANVLIALALADHEHHGRVATWLTGVERVAVCPVVEGSLVRFLVRLGHAPVIARDFLTRLHASPRCEFWPDDLPYAEAELDHVRGHRQVTHAYLSSLAQARGGVLATLDGALARALPGRVVLVP